MARKQYELRRPPRSIRSSGAMQEVSDSDVMEDELQSSETPVHKFGLESGAVDKEQALAHQVVNSVVSADPSTVPHRDTIQDDEGADTHDLKSEGYRSAARLMSDDVDQVKTRHLSPSVAQIMGERSQMSNIEWMEVAVEHMKIPDPVVRHQVGLERNEVEKALELKHEKMTTRLQSLQKSAAKTEAGRETATERASREAVRPLRDQRFESERWLDRVVIDQLETSDNELHIRSQEEGDDIKAEVDELLLRHEMGDMLGEEVREEYRELRKRQARAKEVVRREPFKQDRATMGVLDDHTAGTRHPEESSDPRRIMEVVHDFNSQLAELLPLFSEDKERLPAALVEASEHLTNLVGIADSVLLYSGVPVFDQVPRQEIMTLINGMLAAGRGQVVRGELVERSDLGGWGRMTVDDGTGRPISEFEALLGIDEQTVRERISLFSLQVLQACGTGSTDALEFRDLSFPD